MVSVGDYLFSSEVITHINVNPPQQDSELNNREKNVFYVCIYRARKANRAEEINSLQTL